MSNYSTRTYEKSGRYYCDVTVDMPEMPNCEATKVVSFNSDNEQDLDEEVTRFIIKINNNID